MSISLLDHAPQATALDSGDAAGCIEEAQIATPCWWRQPYSWTFAGLVGLNILLTAPALRSMLRLDGWLNDPWSYWVQMGMIGLFMGQLYLAAIWLAFGGSSAPLRFAVVMTAVLLGAVSGTLAASMETEWGDTLVIAVGVSLLVVLLAQLVFAPVRWLTGWRIDFDAAYHPPESGRRMQVWLWHYLVLTFLATLPLVVYRVLDAVAPDMDAAGLFLSAALLAGMTLLAAGPLTWLILVPRRPLRTLLAFPLGLAAAAALGFAITAATSDESWLDATELVFLIVLPLTALIPVAFNLLVLRCLGLHVISVKKACT